MFRRYVLAGAIALTAGAANAAPFSYDYVEGGFGEVDSGESIFIGASKSLDNNLFILGNVYAVDFDHGVEGAYVEGGVGYHVPLSAQADFFTTAQLLYSKFDVNHGDDDDLGGIARAGLRFTPVDKVELEGSVALSSNDFLVDDGLGFSASARYHIDPRLSAAIGYSSETELDGAFINVRYALK